MDIDSGVIFQKRQGLKLSLPMRVNRQRDSMPPARRTVDFHRASLTALASLLPIQTIVFGD